jgi:guanosine-3',5'-bis(diphosphate) 3'-pyrophosphohydrolase
VLEDTPVDPSSLLYLFSPMVAHYVSLLTDPELVVGNRAARKAMTVERLMGAPNEVKTIKLADLLDNGPSIVEHDPAFAKVFVREKAILLPSLLGGDEGLFKKAVDFLYAVQTSAKRS